MGSLVFIIVSLILLGSFYVLTWYETTRGVRLLAPYRSQFDEIVDRMIFIWKHVDLAAFLREEVEHLLRTLLHRAVHVSLKLVRMLERQLTRLIRYFRMRQASLEAPGENAREFVKTLSDFKDGLNSVHPELSDKED
ncbi:MAG: hypothetical protein JWN18_21 [Parcubacteria group bacterium]|nr:hypothetical protein [Parcubacteria group bacterium]